MQTWLKVLNWLAIALFGAAIIALGLMQPSKSVPAVLNLVPFGFALLAVRPNSRSLAARFAVGFNGLWALLYLLIMWLAGSDVPGGLFFLALFCVPVAVLCIFNVKALWPRASGMAGA